MKDTVTAIENDPWLIAQRADLLTLEEEKDRLYDAMRANPGSVPAKVAYDAAVLRWVHAKVNWDNALKQVLGL